MKRAVHWFLLSVVACGEAGTGSAPSIPDSGGALGGSVSDAHTEGGTGGGAPTAGGVAGDGAGGAESQLPECMPPANGSGPDLITPIPDPGLPVAYAGIGIVQSRTEVTLTIALEPSGQLELQRLALPPLAEAGDELEVKVRRVGNGLQDEDMAFELRNAHGDLILFSYQMPFDAALLDELAAPIQLSFEPLCDDTLQYDDHSWVQELVTILSHEGGQVRALPRTSQHIRLGDRPYTLNVYFAREFGPITDAPPFTHLLHPGIHLTLQLVAQAP